MPSPKDTDPIKKIRAADAAVTVLRPDGTPLADQDVLVSQTKHKFLFGTASFDIVLPASEASANGVQPPDERAEKLAALCNAVTLPFYWARFEPQRGKPDTDRLMRAAHWCLDRGMLLKGHPLCWHTLTADWLLEMSNTEIREAQVERIQRDVQAFRGLIDSWDVLNEVVIMPIFDKYDNGITRLCRDLGRIQMVRTMFEAARAANPSAVLLLNDFDVSPAYDILVEGCLEAGIQIDVIGIQSHMHQGWWGVEKTQQVLENFTRFGLPIHFTETTLVSGHLMPPHIVDLNDYQVTDWPTTLEGEERQAEEVIQHYKTLLAHPLVQSITWWELADGGWLNAPAGLIRADGSSKPAYDELLALVKGEWWLPPTRLTTDNQGMVNFTGFLGEYELSYDGKNYPFKLEQAGTAALEIRL